MEKVNFNDLNEASMSHKFDFTFRPMQSRCVHTKW